MRRGRLLALLVALCPLVGLPAAVWTPAAATARTGQTYGWVGSSINHDADNHSWTDPRNWSPEGVPGDLDAVNIVSPQTEPCDVHVDNVPRGVELTNLLLSTSTTKGCHASLSGGSITIRGTMEWTGGTLATRIVISPGSGVLIGDEPVHVIERLRQPLTVHDASLTLASAHLRIQDGGSIHLDSAAGTTVTFSSNLKDVRSDDERPGIMDRGTLRLFAPLLLDSVEMRQSGPAELDDGARLVVGPGAVLRLPEADHPLLVNGGSLTGQGTIDGDIVNAGGVFDPARVGAGAPLTLLGSYRQTSGGRLVLDLSAASAPIAFEGSVAVAGIVTYQNARGYRPDFGDERTPLSAGEALTWTPTCEETKGARAGQGHWHSEADQRVVLATFERGSSGSCA